MSYACLWKPVGLTQLHCHACGRTIDTATTDPRDLDDCPSWFDYSAPVGYNVRQLCRSHPTAMQGNAPTKMAVVSVHFNFAGWQSTRDNYRRFVHEMKFWGVPCFAAELVLADQQFELPDAFLRCRGTERNILWQKEALLNQLVAKLPAEYDAVAWLDADMLFLNRNWYAHAMSLLAEYPVVQLYDRWHLTDQYGAVNLISRSVGRCGEHFLQSRATPGGAWAARRNVFPLYAAHAVGGNDVLITEAWLGMVNTVMQKNLSPAWKQDYGRWAGEAWSKIQGHVGHTPGDCVHLYHGEVRNRAYGEREEWLRRHDYDPAQHVRVDEQGLLAWTDAAPSGLVEQVRDYFYKVRKEDEGFLC